MKTVLARDMFGRFLQVYLDGENVSSDCFEATLPKLAGEKALGNVGLFVKEDGRIVVENNEPVRIYKDGIVCFEWLEETPQVVIEEWQRR